MCTHVCAGACGGQRSTSGASLSPTPLCFGYMVSLVRLNNLVRDLHVSASQCFDYEFTTGLRDHSLYPSNPGSANNLISLLKQPN